MSLQGYRLVFLFCNQSDESGIGRRRGLRWAQQGVPVGVVGELEGVGTGIKAAGLEIAKGNISLRWRRQKAREWKNLGGIRGCRVGFNDQCDISLITDQILESQQSGLGRAVRG